MRMLPALASTILLLGRADAARPRVHRGGRNWLVAQDLIGACHMDTCVHKKIPRHMKLRAHTRDTANSPGKSAFSGSLQRKRHASFAHCQGHNGWRLACRMHVYAGGSDHMLYQRTTVLTPGITASCSSVQPSLYHRSPSLPPGKSEDFCNMKSARFQTLGTNKKVIIVHPQTRY